MSFSIPRKQLKKAEAYRKTEMRTYLVGKVVNPLRDYIILPRTVAEAKTVLLMFIDTHVELQTGKPPHTMNNLLQFALAHRSATGRKLNLSMEGVGIEEEDLEEEEERPKKRTKKVEEEDDDQDTKEQVEKLRRKLQLEKRKKQIEAELRQMEEAE
jgi:hypothetical protein